jgi:MFS family permease
MFCVVAAVLALGLAESVYFAVIDQGLHKPVTFLGVMQSAMGVGAITGGILITSLIKRTGDQRPVAVGLGLVAAGVALSMVPSAPVVVASSLLVGAGLPITIVCITTILQRHTPAPIQGRVFTTFETFTGAPQVLSIAVGAALVSVVQFRILLAVMTAGLALASVYAFVRLRDPAGAAQTDDDGSDLADLPVLDHEPAVGVHPFQQPAVVADK